MAIESWIDEIVKAAGTVKSHTGGQVRAYRVYEKAEIPESLSVFPCAITYVQGLQTSYSLGGVCIDLWDGVTEFHLFPDTSKKNYPEMARYFGKIRAAFAASMSLNGKVGHFLLKPGEQALLAVNLTYGVEVEHHGIVAAWTVKENVTGQYTVGV